MKEETQSEPEVADNLTGCLAISLCVAFSPIAALYQAFAMYTIYNWYLRMIPHAPDIHIGNMIGVVLLIQMSTIYLMYSNPGENKKQMTMEDTVENVFTYIKKSVMVPSVFLFFGWLYHFLFMRNI